MREIFNRIATLLSPTRQLHEEIVRFGSNGPVEDLLPSVEKVRRLIKKGAKVNAIVDLMTPLSECAYEYRDQIQSNGRVWVDGREVTQEDRKAFANRFLEVAKVLVEAGADPRVGRKFPNGKVDPDDGSMSWLETRKGVDSALVNDFKDLLIAAEAAAVKQDANKPKTSKFRFK